MYIEALNTFILIDNTQYNIYFPQSNNSDDALINNHQIIFKNDLNTLKVSIKNKSNRTTKINKFEVHISSLDCSGYSNIISSPEFPNEIIKLKSISATNQKEIIISHLYSAILGHNEYLSLICGFLSSHTSRNYIKLYKKNNCLEVYAVWDLTSQEISPNEVIELDTLFMEYGKNYFDLLNNYAQYIAKSDKIIDPTISYRIDNPLFSKSPSNLTFKKNNKNLSTRINGKKLYPIDISSPLGKEYILNRYKECSDSQPPHVFMQYIKPYIKLISKSNSFNVYRELALLLEYIKTTIPDIKILFDDCPIGIAARHMNILHKSFTVKPRGLIKKLYSSHNKLHYDFIIRTIVQRGMFSHSNNFDIKNPRIKNAMELISLSETLRTNESALDFLNDIDDNTPVLVNLSNDDIFSVLRFGKQALYIGVFNFSKSSRRFYWDLSLSTKATIPDGVATDILGANNYLMASGKIDIKHIPPRDCCLIKKSLDSTSTHQI
jgi:hypothetical protein